MAVNTERDIRKNVIAKRFLVYISELRTHSREIMMSNLLTLQRRESF